MLVNGTLERILTKENMGQVYERVVYYKDKPLGRVDIPKSDASV